MRIVGGGELCLDIVDQRLRLGRLIDDLSDLERQLLPRNAIVDVLTGLGDRRGDRREQTRSPRR